MDEDNLLLYSFTVGKPRVHKIYKEPRVRHFKEIKKSVLSHVMFYLGDDDYKPVDFNNETISFTCQLVKI